MMRLLPLWIGFLLACAACDEAPAPTVARRLAAAPAAAPVDGRDQYALAGAIATALAEEDDPAALTRVVRAWQGRRYRWTLAFVPALCSRPDRCVLAPFDQARFERRPAHGWLPRLELDDAAHQALAEACRDHQPCVIELEAGLKELRLSHELPTRLTLAAPRFLSARAARGGESWIARR